MIKIGKFYVHKKDIIYLKHTIESSGYVNPIYSIECLVRDYNEYINQKISKEEFVELEKKLIVEEDNE